MSPCGHTKNTGTADYADYADGFWIRRRRDSKPSVPSVKSVVPSGTRKRRGSEHRMVSMTAVLRIASLLAVATLAVARAQVPAQNPPSPPDQPTFHIGVDAVRIDAVVTDKDGNLVTDLTADDFEVYEDRRVQKVVLATFVPVADGTRAIRPGSPGPCAAAVRTGGVSGAARVRAQAGPALDRHPGGRPWAVPREHHTDA